MSTRYKLGEAAKKDLERILVGSGVPAETALHVVEDLGISIGRERGSRAKDTPMRKRRARLARVKKLADNLATAIETADSDQDVLEILFEWPNGMPADVFPSVTTAIVDGNPVLELSGGKDPRITLASPSLRMCVTASASDRILQNASPTKSGPSAKKQLAWSVAYAFVVNGLEISMTRTGILERCIVAVLRDAGYALSKHLTTDEADAGPARLVRETVRLFKGIMEKLRPGASALRRPDKHGK